MIIDVSYPEQMINITALPYFPLHFLSLTQVAFSAVLARSGVARKDQRISGYFALFC